MYPSILELKDWQSVNEKRLELLSTVCRNSSFWNLTHSTMHRFVLDRIFVCDKHKILFCQTPKVGNTQWKKVLIVLNGKTCLKEKNMNSVKCALYYLKYIKIDRQFILFKKYSFFFLLGKFSKVENIPENLVHDHERNGLPRLSSMTDTEIHRRFTCIPLVTFVKIIL